MTPPLLQPTDRGLWCAAGDFHIDPWRAVPRAVVTHAHGDHVAWGCERYLCAAEGAALLAARTGAPARVASVPYGEPLVVNGVRLSFHPAGHILGSAMVRVEHAGEVWVVSGDYKTSPDATSTPWAPVRCHTFVTESTFGLPIYRWPAQATVAEAINRWWQANAEAGRASLLMGYALGKAQRLLSLLDPAIGPIVTHGAVEKLTRLYREAGVALPPTHHAATIDRREALSRAIVIAPPSVLGSTWTRRFGDAATAFASGWMQVRGARRRRGVDRGFVLSDHVDWPGLLEAIDATGAERLLVTHGFTQAVVRYLREQGRDASVLPTRWEGERDDAPEEPDVAPEEA